MFVQGAWNYFSSFSNRIEIIPVKILNPQYVVRIMELLNDQWRHCDVTELYFGFNLAWKWIFVFPKYDRLSLIPSFCPVFVRQLSVLGNFDSGTSIITLIMGLLRTKNWNKKQKILKMLPRKYFRFIKNWHYGIIRFEIISVWKIFPFKSVPIVKISSPTQSFTAWIKPFC